MADMFLFAVRLFTILSVLSRLANLPFANSDGIIVNEGNKVAFNV